MRSIFLLLPLVVQSVAAQVLFNVEFREAFTAQQYIHHFEDDLEFNNCEFKSSAYILTADSVQHKYFYFRNSVIEEEGARLYVTRDYRTVLIDSARIFNLAITFDAQTYHHFNNDWVQVNISNSKIRNLNLEFANLDNVSFDNIGELGKVYMHKVRFKGTSFATGLSVPDSLFILDVDFGGLTGDFELSRNAFFNSKKICQLLIERTDCSKLKLDYAKFHLTFAKGTTLDDKAIIYQQLLDNFKTRGSISNYEKLDKEFKEFKYKGDSSIRGQVANWIDKHWWDYGYNKSLIFRNALILNLIFFFINLIFYRQILVFTYKLEAFNLLNDQQADAHRESPVKYFFIRIPYVFLYTGFIFWGLKLDVQNINIRRIGWFFYILTQYVTGVVCLAYIANYIITR